MVGINPCTQLEKKKRITTRNIEGLHENEVFFTQLDPDFATGSFKNTF